MRWFLALLLVLCIGVTSLSAAKRNYYEARESQYIYDEYYKGIKKPRPSAKLRRAIKPKTSTSSRLKKRSKVRKPYLKKRRPKRRVVRRPSRAPKRFKPREQGQYQTLFGIKGRLYGGVEVASTNLSRKVNLKSKNTGENLYRNDNGALLGPANGSTYSFTQDESYTRMVLRAGIQKKGTKDYYEIGFHSNDLVSDFLFTAGYGYPQYSLWGIIPQFRILGGLGWTGSENMLPTNLSIGVGGGILYDISKDFEFEFGALYQKRQWVELDKDIGQEKWDDSEFMFGLGLKYLF